MPARRTTLVLACTMGTSVAHAQGTEVATARQLAIQGIDAVEAGNCATGSPLLERAEHLHHASVHLQYLARCRLAEGKMVEATEMWRRVVRDGAPAGSSPALVAAVSEATAQLEKTLPRLSTTTLRTAERYLDLELVLDGAPISPELVGAPQILDPGRHELTARAPGFEPWSKRWRVAAGAATEIVIELSPEPRAGAAARGGADRREAPVLLEPAGWVTASVGAAALIGGAVTTLMRNNRRSHLERMCPDRQCTADRAAQMNDDIDAVRSLTTASNVLLFGGGALLAGGTVMIVVGRTSTPGRPGVDVAALLPGAPGADAGLTFRQRW